MHQTYNLVGVILCILLAGPLYGQSAHQFLRKGDRAYRANEFGSAEEYYRKAETLDPSSQGSYNLGNTIYQQGRYEEAVPQYESAARRLEEQNQQASAFHNLGNALFQKGDYKQARDAYQSALRRNPDDLATKHNLAMVNNQIQQQQQQNQSQEDQSNPPQQDQEDPPSDQEQQPREQSGEPQEDPSSPQEEVGRDLTREEALQLLQVMDQEEQKVQEKVKRGAKNKPRAEKDW
jgi:tetratricopeptide (TPR) repeat protein